MTLFSSKIPVLFLSVIFLALTAAGCTPRQEIASSHSLSVSGRANFTISVDESLSLASSTSFWTYIPSDVSVNPTGKFRYALFSDSLEGPVGRHAHIIFSELPQEQWQWEKETWAMPESLLYEKDRMAGKYWTIQMFPVFSSRDWFSHLWEANGRQSPEYWIAKRWSSTPETYIRIVAEYREPAPLCMRERLAIAEERDKRGIENIKGKELWRNCEQELQEFTARADAVFFFDRAVDLPSPESAPLVELPQGNPDMGKLVGKAEYNDTFSVGDGK